MNPDPIAYGPPGHHHTSSAEDAGFFQPGRTYTRYHHGQRVEFHVRHVSAAPGSSYRVAFGWRLDVDGDWEPFDSDDLTGWTDTTDTTATVTEPSKYDPEAGR